MTTATPVTWANRSAKRLHLGARVGDGPLLTAEGCQHDQSGDDVELIPDTATTPTEAKAAASTLGYDPCDVCIGGD